MSQRLGRETPLYSDMTRMEILGYGRTIFVSCRELSLGKQVQVRQLFCATSSLRMSPGVSGPPGTPRKFRWSSSTERETSSFSTVFSLTFTGPVGLKTFDC